MPIYDDPNTQYDQGSVQYDGGANITMFTPPADLLVPPVYIGPNVLVERNNDEYFPCDPLMQKLMRHYRKQPRGRNIFLMSDGTVRDSQIQGTPPNMIQPPTDPYATYQTLQTGPGTHNIQTTQIFQVPYVKRTLYGGSDNFVNAAEQAQLTAAGYGQYLH